MVENKLKKSLNVTIYKTLTCPFCHMAEEFFKKNNIKFKSIDVGNDQKAAQGMIKKSGQMSVPVIDVNGRIIIGFDKNALKKTLKIK